MPVEIHPGFLLLLCTWSRGDAAWSSGWWLWSAAALCTPSACCPTRPAASTGAVLLLPRQGGTGTSGAWHHTGLSRVTNWKTQGNPSAGSGGKRHAVTVPEGRWAGGKRSYEQPQQESEGT